MKKPMTHTVVLKERIGGFSSRYEDRIVQCRLLKNHIVLQNGTKYKKVDGLMAGGHKYMGVYMEKTQVKPNTIKEI